VKNLKHLALLVVALAAFAGFQPAFAQEDTVPTDGYPVNTITVSGLGTAFGAPDVAYVDLGVEIVNVSLAEAYPQANTTISAVIDALIAAGIPAENIRTSEVNIFSEDQYDPMTGPTGVRQFRVRNIVRVTITEVDRVGEIITAAVDAGANTIYGFTFGLQNPGSMEQEARVAAVANARDRATQLAEALGVTLGQPTVISEGVSGFVPPMPYGMGGGGGVAMDSAMQVSQGQLQVQVQVQVTFSISQ
jgi:uncharacterized protein